VRASQPPPRGRTVQQKQRCERHAARRGGGDGGGRARASGRWRARAGRCERRRARAPGLFAATGATQEGAVKCCACARWSTAACVQAMGGGGCAAGGGCSPSLLQRCPFSSRRPRAAVGAELSAPASRRTSPSRTARRGEEASQPAAAAGERVSAAAGSRSCELFLPVPPPPRPANCLCVTQLRRRFVRHGARGSHERRHRGRGGAGQERGQEV